MRRAKADGGEWQAGNNGGSEELTRLTRDECRASPDE